MTRPGREPTTYRLRDRHANLQAIPTWCRFLYNMPPLLIITQHVQQFVRKSESQCDDGVVRVSPAIRDGVYVYNIVTIKDLINMLI